MSAVVSMPRTHTHTHTLTHTHTHTHMYTYTLTRREQRDVWQPSARAQQHTSLPASNARQRDRRCARHSRPLLYFTRSLLYFTRSLLYFTRSLLRQAMRSTFEAPVTLSSPPPSAPLPLPPSLTWKAARRARLSK